MSKKPCWMVPTRVLIAFAVNGILGCRQNSMPAPESQSQAPAPEVDSESPLTHELKKPPSATESASDFDAISDSEKLIYKGTLAEIFDLIDADPVAFGSAYHLRVVEMTALIHRVWMDDHARIWVTLRSHPPSEAEATIDVDQPTLWPGCSPGQEVTLRARVAWRRNGDNKISFHRAVVDSYGPPVMERISAPELTIAFLADPADAMAKYEGQFILVHGECRGSVSLHSVKAYSLEGYDGASVSCEFGIGASSKHLAFQLLQPATILGKVVAFDREKKMVTLAECLPFDEADHD